MKKLMIAAAVSALSAGVFAGACDDTTVEVCRAWDVSMKLKSFGPKKTTCKSSSECEDVKSNGYYLDDASHKIKGYLWICDYACGNDFNVVLWDDKNNKVIIPVAYEAVNFDEVYVYGKKATKVAGTISFAGADLQGNDTIDVVASGMKGKLVRGKDEEDCYIKSLSGYVAGKLAWIPPTSTTGGSKGGLCEEPVEPEECPIEAVILDYCSACCFDSWCDVEDAAPEMLPTVGTWKMKYNKNVSKGKKAISQLVPGYAL